MTGQFDMFAEPVELPRPPAPVHIMVIEEFTLGDPAKRRGYLGKYRGRWIHHLVSAATFNRYNDTQKQGMQDRLRAWLEQDR